MTVLAPEVVLVGDHTLSRVRWTLEQETARLDALVEDTPEVADLLAKNGWSTRMLAWGHIIAGLLDLAGFDDEDGRT